MSKKGVLNQLKLDKYISHILSTQPNAYDSSPGSSKQTPSEKGSIEKSRKQQNYHASPTGDFYMSQNVLTTSEYKRQKEHVLAAETQLDSAKISPFAKISEKSSNEERTPYSKFDSENKYDNLLKKKLELRDDFDIPSSKKPTPAGFYDNNLIDSGIKFDPKEYLKKDYDLSSKKEEYSKKNFNSRSKFELDPIDEKLGDSFDESDHLLIDKIFEEDRKKNERSQFQLFRETEVSGGVIELPRFEDMSDSLEEKFISEVNEKMLEKKLANQIKSESITLNPKKLMENVSSKQSSNSFLSEILREERSNSKNLKISQKEITNKVSNVNQQIDDAAKYFDNTPNKVKPFDSKSDKSGPKLLPSNRNILRAEDESSNLPPLQLDKKKKLSKEEALRKLMKAFGDDPDEEDLKLRDLLENQIAMMDEEKPEKSPKVQSKIPDIKNEESSKSFLNIPQHDSKNSLTNIFRDKLENSKSNSGDSELRKNSLTSQRIAIPNIFDSPIVGNSQNATPFKGLENLSQIDLKKSLSKASPKHDAMSIENESVGFQTANNRPLNIPQSKMNLAEMFFEEKNDDYRFSIAILNNASQRLTVQKQNSIHNSTRIFKDEEPSKIFNMDLSNYILNPQKHIYSNKKKVLGVSKIDAVDRAYKLFGIKDPVAQAPLNLALTRSSKSAIEKPIQFALEEEFEPANNIKNLQSEPLNNHDPLKKKVFKQENSQGLWPEQRKDGPKLLRGKPRFKEDPAFGEQDQPSSLQPQPQPQQQIQPQPQNQLQQQLNKPFQLRHSPETLPAKEESLGFGFKNARGSRIEADPDMLMKLKGFLEENSNSRSNKKNESVSPRENQENRENSKSESSKKSLRFNMIAEEKKAPSPIQTKVPSSIMEQEDELSNFNVKILSPKSSVHEKSNSIFPPRSPRIEYDIKINSPACEDVLRPLVDPEDEPHEQVTKKRLTNFEGLQKANMLNDATNKDSLRFPFKVSQSKSDPKKSQNIFKFKENNDDSLLNSSKKTPTTAKTSTTRMSENTSEGKNMKRNYDAFLKGIDSPNKNQFDENIKIQSYLSTLRFRGPSQYTLKPRATYFTLENIKKKPNKKFLAINSINSTNAASHIFVCACTADLGNSNSNQFSEASFECGCNGSSTMGWLEMRQILLQEGLKSEYLTEDWMRAHFRFVVWKFASIERRLEKFHSSKRLTYMNVKNEIQYRYYIEHVLNKRSVLKKITESDERSTLHMVLLIGDIKLENSIYTVELTDGWFSVYLEIKVESSYKSDKNSLTNNQLLYQLVRNKKLYSGLKVHIYGMKLTKKQIGGTKSPLTKMFTGDDSKTIHMAEINYNGLSRAKWDEKLGMSKDKFFPKNLLSLRNNGGIIPMIDVFVVKKYQILERVNGTTRIFQDSDESKILSSNIFFKIKVADAIIYYDQDNIQKHNNMLCELEISCSTSGKNQDSGVVVETYGALMEHTRVRFYNVRGYTRYGSNFRFYDHMTKNKGLQYLYLQYTKSTICDAISENNLMRGKMKEFQDFSKATFNSNNFLLTSIPIQERSTYSFYLKDIKTYKNEIDLVGIILESDHQKMIGMLKDGNLFYLMIHSKQHFPNIKLLDKKDSVVVIRNAQVDLAEKISGENAHCFGLRTTENTFFTSSTALFKAEAEALIEISKSKEELDKSRKRLEKYQKKKKNGLNSSDSIDFDALDKLMTDNTPEN